MFVERPSSGLIFLYDTTLNDSWGNFKSGARVYRLGDRVIMYGSGVANTGAPTGSNFSVTLPPELLAKTSGSDQLNSRIGWANFRDIGTTNFMGIVILGAEDSLLFNVGNASGTYTNSTNITPSIPMTWVQNDEMNWYVDYQHKSWSP